MSIPAVPKSLQPLLDAFRPCFTTSTFTTFVALTVGVIAAPTRRTVCGMLTAARLGGTWHHSAGDGAGPAPAAKVSAPRPISPPPHPDSRSR
ncbi:hypothetical protein ACIA5H_21710 [Nocardia sp. NPDC051900]|uniref:hypothetical protein n=1 Tax=Nocardia sp. NPDC051900 TaxID=3364326 RepID=UPI00378C6C7A